MVTMWHPNGCVHNVKDELVDRFMAAGWKIKEAAPIEQPPEEQIPVLTEQKPKKPRAKSKK